MKGRQNIEGVYDTFVLGVRWLEMLATGGGIIISSFRLLLLNRPTFIFTHTLDQHLKARASNYADQRFRATTQLHGWRTSWAEEVEGPIIKSEAICSIVDRSSYQGKQLSLRMFVQCVISWEPKRNSYPLSPHSVRLREMRPNNNRKCRLVGAKVW